MKILIVENDEDTREVMHTVLAEARHDVVSTGSGEKGVQLAEGRDLVLLDLGLDNISGWEVAKAIRALHPTITIYVITGQTVTPEQKNRNAAYVDDVFRKPFSLDLLFDLVARTQSRLARSQAVA